MRLPRKQGLAIDPEGDQGDVSGIVEETMESLSSLVAGWRAELARSAERAAGVEASIGLLSSSLDTWKANLARTQASTERKLERVMDMLEESGTDQAEAALAEVRKAVADLTSMLGRSIDDFKAELKYGTGLSEVKLLSAVEGLGARLGQIKGSLDEWKSTLAESGNRTEARLVRALEALEGGILRTGSVTSEIESEIKGSLAPLVASHTAVESTLAKLTGLVQEWHGQVALAAANTEKRLLLSLEALETAIELSLTGRQDIEKRLLARLEEHETTRAQHELWHDRLDSSLEEFDRKLETWHRQHQQTARDVAGGLELENKILLRLEQLEIRLARAEEEDMRRSEELQGPLRALIGSIEGWAAGDPEAAKDFAALHDFGQQFVKRIDELESRFSRALLEATDHQERMEASLVNLSRDITAWREKGLERAARTKDSITETLRSLEAKIELYQNTAPSVPAELGELSETIAKIPTAMRQYGSVMRGLEELDQGVLRNADDIARLGQTFEQRMQDLEARMAESIASHMARLEANIAERNNALARMVLGRSQPRDVALEDPEGGMWRRKHPGEEDAARPGRGHR